MVSIAGLNLALCLFVIQLTTVVSGSDSTEASLERRLLAILNNFQPCKGRHHHHQDSTSEESGGSSEEIPCKCKFRHHRHHHEPCANDETTTTEKPSDNQQNNSTCPVCRAERICPTVADCPICPAETPKTCPACPTTAPTQPTTCSACPAPPSCPATPTCPPAPRCPVCPEEKTCPTAPPCPTQGKEKQKTTCDAGWKYFNATGFCYFVGPSANATDAQRYCRSQGGDLASIHSAEENAFIVDYVNSSLPTLKQPYYFIIGQYRTGPNASDFANYDGTPMDYTNFLASRPDNFQGHQYCNTMMNGDKYWGLWDDNYCPTAYNYVCKKPASKY